jgi:CubicO group peptidase (beta-lactamase class C family)
MISSGKRPGKTRLLTYAVIIAIISSFLFYGCGQRKKDPFAAARRKIERLMKRENIASFQVAVARDGKIIYEEAFGMANVRANIPATTETRYQVASIEKPFVSTALMMLAERGKIDLDAPVNDYLGDEKLIAYRGDASDATVARLLLHVSGMAYGYYICSDSIPLEQRRSNADILGLAGVLVYAPGTVYEYTNYGYGLLGDIAAHAAGVDLNEFIMNEIIVPLGLTHTCYFRSEPPEGMIATQNVEEGTVPFSLNSRGYSVLFSTAGDLARFGMFHLKHHPAGLQPVLADSSIDRLRKYREAGVPFTTRRLAWDVQKDYGYEVVMHGGGGPGIHNYLYMVPSEDLVIAYMSNARYASSDKVLVALLAASIPDFSLMNRLQGRGWPQWPRLDPTQWKGDWTGKISGPKGSCDLDMTFDAGGKPKLRLREGGKSGEWISAWGKPKGSYERLCYRFNASIPYLYPFAPHDEIVFILKPEGGCLTGSASAAKEKNFCRGENYVLPQYIELVRKAGH